MKNTANQYLTPIIPIIEKLDLGGRLVNAQAYGNGLINDTYLVTLDGKEPRRVILQRVNHRVFSNPAWIMENLRIVLDHVHQRQAANGQALRDLQLPNIYRSRKQQDFVTDTEGRIWRAMSFLDNTRSYDKIIDLNQAAEVGFTLGRFHALLYDLEPDRLRDTLPGFHITPRYLAQFTHVSARYIAPDPELEWCLAFVRERQSLVGVLEAAKHSGLLPVRPIHGDPKLNNILFDNDSGRSISLIDLDTAKPGLLHYDIGDCLRSCCNRSGESPDDPSQVDFDLDICHAILQSYLAQTRHLLTQPEYGYLYDAIRLLPFELGMRFLTDHLQGNRYFKTRWEGQNLNRAMTQFHLTGRIEQNGRRIRALVTELTRS